MIGNKSRARSIIRLLPLNKFPKYFLALSIQKQEQERVHSKFPTSGLISCSLDTNFQFYTSVMHIFFSFFKF